MSMGGRPRLEVTGTFSTTLLMLVVVVVVVVLV